MKKKVSKAVQDQLCLFCMVTMALSVFFCFYGHSMFVDKMNGTFVDTYYGMLGVPLFIYFGLFSVFLFVLFVLSTGINTLE